MIETEARVKRKRKNISIKRKEGDDKRKKEIKMSKNMMKIDMIVAEVKIGIKNRKNKKIKSVDLILIKKISKKVMRDIYHL